jgi:PAS domain-containing protein
VVIGLFLQGDNNHLTSIDLDDLFNDMYYDLEPNPVTSSTTSGAGGAVKTVVVPSASPATEEEIRKRKMDAAGIKQQQHVAAAADLGGGGGGGSGMSVGSGDDGGYGGDDAAGSKELTEEQRIERRERNREHAKRSRLRKKFLLESLQEQIHGLEEQIDGLKSALKQEVPQKADELIAKICGDKEKYTPLPMPSGFGPVKTIMEPDFRLMSALSGSQQNFAISDPTLPDNPIVYVSQGFLDLTGYTLDQVLGRNCRFLQGPGTDQSAVEVIRKGIAEGVDTSVCLLNYKVRTQIMLKMPKPLSLISAPWSHPRSSTSWFL